MKEKSFDLVAIGAGPGGYVAAIRAAQLGLNTALIEKESVGGVCLNWGCIPSKSLLKNAELIDKVRHGEEYGIFGKELTFDYSIAHKRSRAVVEKITQGIKFLLKKNNVEVFYGEAVFDSVDKIKISDEILINAKNVIISTGARARSIPGIEIDRKIVITSREALDLQQLPSKIVIIGGGATGVEFGYVFNSYGIDVHIVELLPRLVPNEDHEISAILQKSFQEKGINVHTDTAVDNLTIKNSRAELSITHDSNTETIDADQVLVCAGVQANTEALHLERIGVKTEKGFVVVDENMKTNVEQIYAIGDVTGKMLLAHVASAQGAHVVEYIAGLEPEFPEYKFMPKATYCLPQIASFGFTEDELKEQGILFKIGKFSFAGNGKAIAVGDSEGLAKILVAEEDHRILGVHLIGPEVTEMLGSLSMTRMLEGTSDELAQHIFAHPTIAEVIKEAGLAVNNEAIHS